MSEHKAKGLFDHVKAITSEQDPKYWDKLEDADKKSWSNYMIHRFLSMEPEWIDTIAELQPYTEILEPKELYLAYIGILPKSRKFLKYVKGKKEDKHEKWLVQLVKQDYQCSIKESEDYLDILYATKKGREHIKYICEKYGTEPKVITKLKLKV
jgi:hypothetical protein